VSLLMYLATVANAGAQGLPETDYVLQCRGCHGAEGAGVPGRVPPLSGVAELLEPPAGRARLLAVPGIRQSSLSDERLARLLEWVALRFAVADSSANFAPLSTEEVTRLR